MKVSRLLGLCRRRGDLSPLYRVGPMRLVRRVKPWPEAGRHAPSLPAGLACVSAGFVPVFTRIKLLTGVTGVWIPAFAGMTVACLDSCLRRNDGRLAVPPLAGGYGRMGGVLLGIGMSPAQYRIGCAMTGMVGAQVLRTDYGPSRIWADFGTFLRFRSG